jgi:hypothetical protein
VAFRPNTGHTSSPKRQYVRWSIQEENRLLDWLNTHKSLTWVQLEQQYKQEFGIVRRQDSIQLKMNWSEEASGLSKAKKIRMIGEWATELAHGLRIGRLHTLAPLLHIIE